MHNDETYVSYEIYNDLKYNYRKLADRLKEAVGVIDGLLPLLNYDQLGEAEATWVGSVRSTYFGHQTEPEG